MVSFKLLVWAYMITALYITTIAMWLPSDPLSSAVLYPSSAVGLLLLLHTAHNRTTTLLVLPWVVSLPWVCMCKLVWVHWAACFWLSGCMLWMSSGRFQQMSGVVALVLVLVAFLSVNITTMRSHELMSWDAVVLCLLMQGLLALFPFHNLIIHVKIDKKK
jgi:hypothetical protein